MQNGELRKNDSRTILLVEDERDIRNICRIILERAGFTVIEAGSGDEAQQVWQSDGNEIDLLLTDFNIPDLSGLQLIEFVRAPRPDLPILLISGRSAEDLELPRYIPFLQKPFSPAKLVQLVEQQFEVASQFASTKTA